MEKRVENESETRRLAAQLAPLLRAGDVLTLHGTLGAGKTAFARALVQALAGGDIDVPSPTFTLVQTYDTKAGEVWHFDLYRLPEREMDILELGWEEARAGGITLVEWPDRLGGLLPRDRLDIEIKPVSDSENSRTIAFTPHGRWAERLKGL